MEAIAHSPSFAKKVGVPQSVGQDFSKADKGKTFKRGGEMAGQMDPKMMAMMMAKKRAMAGAGAPAPAAPMGGGMGMKKGGNVKKMASGGLAAGHKSADGIASKGKTKGTNIVMKKGGKVC
jgi:hypothetical protein